MTEFKPWPKIPRGQNETISITEKIDGTNGCIVIAEDGFLAGVQSRNRMITPDDDNFGFAAWVHENWTDLHQLEHGYHYGEWAGPGIQKNPHGLEEREFFLFNTFRWNPDNPNRPKCCTTVPLLYDGPFYDEVIRETMMDLADHHTHNGTTGEGVVVWFHKTRRYEKHTFRTPDGKWCA